MIDIGGADSVSVSQRAGMAVLFLILISAAGIQAIDNISYVEVFRVRYVSSSADIAGALPALVLN